MTAGYAVSLVAALVMMWACGAVSEMVQEEITTRLARLPDLLLQLAALGVRRSTRAEILEEWEAELQSVLDCYDGLPVTRLLRGIGYSTGFFRMAPRAGRVADRLLSRGGAGAHLLQLSRRRRLVKSAFDRSAAFASFVILLPLMCAIAVFISIGGGPVFAREVAIGKGGRLFNIYRFRMTRPGIGLTGEPTAARVLTRVTALLSRYDLDELPQLINVLRGDMSLVGPRPMSPAPPRGPGSGVSDAAAVWGRLAALRLAVRPGITGLWQVNGRDLSLEEAVRLDIRYAQNWSLMLDLQIIWKTWGVAVAPVTPA